MKIATFNVNSVRARLPNLLDWLDTAQPEVVLLQEIKCEAPQFPLLELKGAGYDALVKGQKSYHGVAILSRTPATEILTALPGDDADVQARYLEAEIAGVRVICAYMPNGNPLGTEKFTYKLNWLARLEARLKVLMHDETPFVLGGDFNIIPEKLDAQNPFRWLNDALFQPESRRAWRRLCNLGLTDTFRALHPEMPEYTFWDYTGNAYAQNNGIRIDHFLLSPVMADRLRSCEIDRRPREAEKASDHTPVVLTVD